MQTDNDEKNVQIVYFKVFQKLNLKHFAANVKWFFNDALSMYKDYFHLVFSM